MEQAGLGADLEACGHAEGLSCLMMAAGNDCVFTTNVANVLIAAGADVTARTLRYPLEYP